MAAVGALLVLVTVLVVLEDLAVVQEAVVVHQEAAAMLLNLAHLDCLDLTAMATTVVLTPIRHLTQDLVAVEQAVAVLRVVTPAKHLAAMVVLAASQDLL